jgi:preprotein translocase subunit SecF
MPETPADLAEITPDDGTSATGADTAASAAAGGGLPLTGVQLKAAQRHHSWLSRLTTGTGAFDIIGHRRWYYIFSATVVVLSILFMILRGFNLSIDFVGGTQLTFTPTSPVSTSQVAEVVQTATGVSVDQVVTVGRNVQITMTSLSQSETSAASSALTTAFKLTAPVSVSDVSGTWGSEISTRALIAVAVFLVAVAAFIWLRYEKRVAAGAVVSVIHDLIVTAGVYALIGFEVSPATVIGLLTILGFSLYDTVVVYDKVQENSKGLTSLLRRTYPEAANLAINQTLMRSINTSLIALLPVAGLLVAGVAILGSGTLKDLSLVMLVGMLIGAYSSVFLAVPMAVDLKMRDPQIRSHSARVLAKRKADGLIVDADGDPVGRIRTADAAGSTTTASRRPARGTATVPVNPNLKPGAAPLPGVKPARVGSTPRPRPAAAPESAVSSTGASTGPAQESAAKPPPGGKPPTGAKPTGKAGPRPAGKRNR